MTKVFESALAYHRAGLGVIPIRPDGSKAPALPRGHPYLYRRPTEADLARWFAAGRHGIGVVCGAVSGGLETLDFETVTAYRRWREVVEGAAPGLAARLCWALTPGHLGQRGVHGRYRCPGVAIPGPTPLAYGPQGEETGPPGAGAPAPARWRLLIETRGEGSYAVAPGSPGACHETGRAWQHVGGPDLRRLPELAPRERDALLSAARALDRRPAPRPARAGPPARPVTGGRVSGDDYNARGPDWAAVLGPHGWEVVRTLGAVRYWRRPGKRGAGWSATTGYCRAADGSDLLHVFSSNAPPFRPGGSYSKFRAYAALNHRGDLRAAARELARQFGPPGPYAPECEVAPGPGGRATPAGFESGGVPGATAGGLGHALTWPGLPAAGPAGPGGPDAGERSAVVRRRGPRRPPGAAADRSWEGHHVEKAE
jgi:putative DNA primase/helicase